MSCTPSSGHFSSDDSNKPRDYWTSFITAVTALCCLLLLLLLLFYSSSNHTLSTDSLSSSRLRTSSPQLLLHEDTLTLLPPQSHSLVFDDADFLLTTDTSSTNDNHRHHRALTHRYPPAPTISSDPADCDRSIDLLAQQPGSRIRMFVLYHHDYGDMVIRNFSCNYTRPWVESVKMNITKYFEYYAYHSIFANMTEKDFRDVDFVLITGYRTIIPFNIFNKRHQIEYTLELGFMEHVMKFLKTFPQYQVVPFQYDPKPVNLTMPNAHGDYTIPAMMETLATLNWTENELEKALVSDVFYRNSYAATPREFLRASKIMSQLITAVETNTTLDALYRHNAYYSINKPLTMKAFGAPHYQLHCFVFERILSIIYMHYQAPMFKESFTKLLKRVNVVWKP